MSREHLYKAKRVNWRELPKEEWWVEGAVLQSETETRIATSFFSSGEIEEGIMAASYLVDPETVCEYAGFPDKGIWTNDIYSFFDDFYKAHMLAVARFGEYEQDTSGTGMMPIIGFYFEILKWEYTKESFYDDEEFPKSLRKTSMLSIMNEKIYKDLKCVGNVFDNPDLC